ncbi:MAG: hypothetical protein IKC14_08545 [Kiritimatiellae bacterium]|nr:hypothetical protein [Kiritimatiellia bacterium]
MNRHFILFAIVFAAALSGFAKTFDVDISTGRPAASNEAYYHGETIEFRAVRGRTVVTNIEYAAIYYQTNGMGDVWWKTDGLVFHPTNDVGAANYRFFLEGRDDLGRDWHANGLLRLLPSPGFTPNTIELPVARLDFANIEVANAPYYSKAETEAKIVELAPAPGNYAVVSNAAMNAVQTEVDPVWNAEKSGYATTNDFAVAYGMAFHASMVSDEMKETLDNHRDNTNVHVTPAEKATWNAKQSALAFDATPTAGSTNPVTSGGVQTALALKANAANVYTKAETDAAIAAATPEETDPTVPSWAKAAAKPTYTAAEVGAATAEDVYRLIAGTNVVLVITNYNSAVHAPSMRLQHLDPDTGEHVTYWDETRRHGMTLTNAMDYTDAQIETRAPRAWSHTTSGLGSEAPAGVTWISTPETVIAGGYEYEKVITTAGAVWVLTSNGLSTGATPNSFFRVSASDGTELFSIEKTDSYLVGVNADGITRSGNTVTIPVNVVANAHPYIRATTNLVNAVWTKEDENGFNCPFATVSWSGSSGAYVATVTCAQPQAFFYFEFIVEGVAKIKNSAKTEMTGGIIFNGTTYMPTLNGNKLEFVAQ